MNSQPAAIFVCLVYFATASSKSLELTAVDRLNSALLQLDHKVYEGFLLFAIPAASSAKNLFAMPYPLGEDCVRTARVIMESFAKPSTSFRSLYILWVSHVKAAGAKANGQFQRQVNSTCDYLNEEAKRWPSEFGDFEELKRNVRVPRPAENYIYAIPTDRDVKDWLYSVSVNMDDPEMLKYEIVLQFQRFSRPVTEGNHLDEMGTVKAVDKLSHQATYKSAVDRLFVQALEDFVAELLPQQIDKYAAARKPDFVKKVSRYFSTHPLLMDEFKKVKDQFILDELNALVSEANQVETKK